MIFLRVDTEKKNKITMFYILTLIEMLGAQGVLLFPHALRVILKDPVAALLDYEVVVLRRTDPLMFLTFIFAMIAIYYFAKRKESGIYYGLITGMLMAAGGFPTMLDHLLIH